MARTLKIWNGRGHGKYRNKHLYIAAYSTKECAELVGTACELGRSAGISEINNYYNKGIWGNIMKEIVPTEPCVYVGSNWSNEKPTRVI